MSATPTDGGALPPNHHAHHPGFAGPTGLLAAITFSIRRGADADLAVDLAGVGVGDDVVDIGCGPGVAARRAAARGASSVVGVDPAAVMRRVARAVSSLSAVRGRGEPNHSITITSISKSTSKSKRLQKRKSYD